MRRYLVLVLAVVLALGVIALPAAAGPTGSIIPPASATDRGPIVILQ